MKFSLLIPKNLAIPAAEIKFEMNQFLSFLPLQHRLHDFQYIHVEIYVIFVTLFSVLSRSFNLSFFLLLFF